jgi:endogenous inhibitor of DNA gyrase (YacG/DUF329 family)
MPAAPFIEASTVDPIPPGVRQWAIGPKQCRWILADEAAGAEALMCGTPVVGHRPFCAEHCARTYMPRVAEEGEAKESEEEAIAEHNPKQKEAE